jgi:outer membrane protein assembly factor BamB
MKSFASIASLILAADGRLVIGSQDGRLFCLGG